MSIRGLAGKLLRETKVCIGIEIGRGQLLDLPVNKVVCVDSNYSEHIKKNGQCDIC